MFKLKNYLNYLLYYFILTELFSCKDRTIPFRVDPLFDRSNPETLGLKSADGTESFNIFTPQEGDKAYNHGVVLYPFKNMLYAMWQSSIKDEDAPDTQVFYSRSANGKDWESPKPLTEVDSSGISTSGGWWSDGTTLVAYLCIWPHAESSPKQGYTHYISSEDGLTWSMPQPVTDSKGLPIKGIIEQDVHTLPNGRLLTAFHMQPGLQVTPYYTDDVKGITGWTAGTITRLASKDSTMSRELEPSWFLRDDGAAVMVFRDQNSSFKKLASISFDNGESWTTPVLIDTPDSRAKQSAGNLPDGTAYMVNNPSGSKERFPLAVVLSKDGKVFNQAYLLRGGGSDLPNLHFPGTYKRPGYSYPKSVVWNDYLYVGYATNKETVEITRVPLSGLAMSNRSR